MDRDTFQDRLADYLGDELSRQDRLAFEEYLASADTDRAEVESLQAALHSLRQLPPAPVSDSGGAWRSRPAWGVRALYRPLAYAAMLLIGVGIGWFAKPMPAAEPQDNHPQAIYVSSRTRTHWPSSLVHNARNLSAAFTRGGLPGGAARRSDN